MEKLVAGLVIFILGVIQMFFWKSREAQNKRIDEVCDASSRAHDRITEQAHQNNEKFARRDDVKNLEERLVNTMNTGFNGIKEDIRAISRRD